MDHKPIRLEPREVYDRAIVKTLPDGRAVYSYYRLIKATADHYFKDSDTAQDDATDWVEYNILGLNDEAQSLFKLSYLK